MPILSTVEAQLSLHKYNIAKAGDEKQPQKHGNGKKPVANYEQGKIRNYARVAVLHVL